MKIKVSESLDADLQQAYASEALFDRFDVHSSRSSSYLSTGGYGESFNIYDINSEMPKSYSLIASS